MIGDPKKKQKIIQIHEMILLPHKQQFFFDTFWVLKLHEKINKRVLKTVINLEKDEFAMPLISWPCKKKKKKQCFIVHPLEMLFFFHLCSVAQLSDRLCIWNSCHKCGLN